MKKKTFNKFDFELKFEPCWRISFVELLVVIVEEFDEEELVKCFGWYSSINRMRSWITLISSSRTRISPCLHKRRSFNFSLIFILYVSLSRWDKND